jgi:hypothetical protein
VDSSDRTDRPRDDAEALWGEKLDHLDDLIQVYEKMLTVTSCPDLRSLESCLRDARKITGGIQEIDEQLRRAALPSMPQDPGVDIEELVSRIQALHGRITTGIERQQDKVREEIRQIRVLRRAIASYRPYRRTTGQRFDCEC